MLPPDDADCVRAVALLVDGDKSYAPMEFSRYTGFLLPHRWLVGTCAILADMVEPDETDTFTLVALGTVVLSIMVPCVNSPAFSGLGGRSVVGDKNMVNVVVVGTEPEELDRLDRPPNQW